MAWISSYLSRGWGAWEEGDAVALQDPVSPPAF